MRIGFLGILLLTGIFTGALSLGVQNAHAAPNATPQKSNAVLYSDPVCISNGYLAAQIVPPADGSGVGVTWYLIGICTSGSPNPADIPITYQGGDNYVSVNVFDTNTIYVTGLGTGLVTGTTLENGENVVNLDNYTPGLLAPTSACPTVSCIAIQWNIGAANQGVLITETISIVGSTAATSAIFQTVSVTNPSTNIASHTVGVRYLWDYDVNNIDGSWIREYNGVTPGTILGVETNFPNPGSTMTAYAMGPCAGAPPCTSANFGSSGGSTSVTAYGSITAPTGVTVPSDYVYGWWVSQASTAYFYTPNSNLCSAGTTPNQIGNGLPQTCDDSSGLYYFGGPTGTVIAPGHTDTYGAAISNAASSVALATPTLSTLLSSSSIPAGGSAQDGATLTGATGTAGGTVTYYYTSDNTCQTGGVQVGAPVTVTNGIVPSSSSQVFNTAGTYYWYAVYSGDSGNTGTTSPCNEPLTVSSTSTSTTTTTSTTTLTATATVITTSVGTVTTTVACTPGGAAPLSLAPVPVTTVTVTTTVITTTTTTSTVHSTTTVTTCTTSTTSSSSSTTTVRGVPEFPLSGVTSFLVLALLLPVLALIERMRRTRLDV